MQSQAFNLMVHSSKLSERYSLSYRYAQSLLYDASSNPSYTSSRYAQAVRCTTNVPFFAHRSLAKGPATRPCCIPPACGVSGKLIYSKAALNAAKRLAVLSPVRGALLLPRHPMTKARAAHGPYTIVSPIETIEGACLLLVWNPASVRRPTVRLRRRHQSLSHNAIAIRHAL